MVHWVRCVALAWVASTALLAGVSFANPWFADSLAWVLVFFYAAPAAAGALLAAVTRHWRRPGPARGALLLSGLLVLGGILLWARAATHSTAVVDERPKVVVVGLDGATYDLIDPLVAEGRLPHLARLREGGASGELLSIDPTISPALWTTIATGQLRAKHGVLNFRSLQDDLRAKRFWEIAHDQGLTIGVMDWLVTWPPLIEEGGFWVPSHMARGPETEPAKLAFVQQLLGATRDARAATLTDRITWGIDALLSGLRLSTFVAGAQAMWAVSLSDEALDESYRLQHVALRLYRDLFLSLRAEQRPQLSAVVFYGTDALAHKYWRYLEPEAFPGTDPAAVERYGRVILDYYEAADRVLGEILDSTDENTSVLVVSDHGSQAMEGGEVLRMPRLAGDRLLAALGAEGSLVATGIGNQTIITHGKPADAAADGALARVAALLRGARLDGVEAEPFVVDHADRPGEEGDYVGVSFNLGTGLSGEDAFAVTLRFPNDRDVVLEELVARDFSISGGHHLRGIVILYGRAVQPGSRIESASLPDVAPTVLHLLGLPVGSDMDGRVLLEALEPRFVAEHPVQRAAYGPPETGAGGSDPSMTDSLEERLRELGYLAE